MTLALVRHLGPGYLLCLVALHDWHRYGNALPHEGECRRCWRRKP